MSDGLKTPMISGRGDYNFRSLQIAVILGMSSTATLINAQESFKISQFIDAEETEEQPYLVRDLTVPHIVFKHEDYGKSYLKDILPDKVVLMSLKCEGNIHALDYKGKFKFRYPQIEPRKGLQVAIRNISDYARSDALVDRDLAKAYTAWRDYKDEGYSEDFKFDKKKKEKDNHLYIERRASKHKFHYIVYQGGMDKDDLRDAFLETSEEANVAASLKAFDRVISSGVIESDTLQAKLPFDYTYQKRSEEDIKFNQKTVYTQARCGGFDIGGETTTSKKIYPIGSEEGMQHCMTYMTRPIEVTSSDRGAVFAKDWFLYEFLDLAVGPSYESYKEFGFKEYNGVNGTLYYHKYSTKVPYRTRQEAHNHCHKYY